MISLTHLHLALNHIPVILTPIGLLFAAWALLSKRQGVLTTGLVLIFASGMAVIPVYLSGEPAEESIEGVIVGGESIVEPHEEIAEAALIASCVAGLLALVGLLAMRASFHWRPIAYVTVIAALVSSVLLAITAWRGGEIRHTEIRPGGAFSESGMKAESKNSLERE